MSHGNQYTLRADDGTQASLPGHVAGQRMAAKTPESFFPSVARDVITTPRSSTWSNP
jgi:hypothetical protein